MKYCRRKVLKKLPRVFSTDLHLFSKPQNLLWIGSRLHVKRIEKVWPIRRLQDSSHQLSRKVLVDFPERIRLLKYRKYKGDCIIYHKNELQKLPALPLPTKFTITQTMLKI
jgi:hypothetical protein